MKTYELTFDLEQLKHTGDQEASGYSPDKRADHESDHVITEGCGTHGDGNDEDGDGVGEFLVDPVEDHSTQDATENEPDRAGWKGEGHHPGTAAEDGSKVDDRGTQQWGTEPLSQTKYVTFIAIHSDE